MHKKQMKAALRKLDRSLKQAMEAQRDLTFQAHLSIEAKNVDAPWAVRSRSIDIGKAIELAQSMSIHLNGEINRVTT